MGIVSGTTTTTDYLTDPASGAMSERVQIGAGTPAYNDYLTVDGKIVAERGLTGPKWGAARWNDFSWTATPSSPTWTYFVLDHLGSVAVITDASGAVLQRLSYDAWGKARNPDGSDAACGAITSSTTRGFTNQEQIAAVCLVNLNARLYDPTIGKFLAPDPVVGDPGVPNAFNRYDYVLNNPLSFTDPSGLCFLGCFWKQSWFAPLLDIALIAVGLPEAEVAFGIGGATSVSAAASAFLIPNAIVAGGISGGINGGLKGALLGAAEGAAFAGLVPTLGGGINTLLGTTSASYVGNFVASGLGSVPIKGFRW